ncbi:hypothetical protein PQU92_02685 [Asticcacaulis sp. BYS171W]|uniref:Uncharacterized protein n=1 Tax=Asticcacaulis aquaticus TaxID=2984212 RepID=A0ABT5HQA4_9CAUL|nr:hypothetical protein [Asticcacaulis aquaticus]MDC7682164.1 hypothetical protein [Asticcacaulis aquaticus]
MSTLYSRTFRSTPHRTARATWDAIISLLCQGRNDTKFAELSAVAGIASSLISDQAPASSPIVVTCDGPRTRIYCTFDDAAIEDEGNEDALGFDPLAGNWAISLPCPADDLAWVEVALAAKSTRITARDLADKSVTETKAASQDGLVLDLQRFLAS